MRHASVLALCCSAACWLAAGPGGDTARALLACRDHMAHHATAPAAPGAPAAPDQMPGGGPCFCAHMTAGFDLALSVAVPAPEAQAPLLRAPLARAEGPARFPLPPSPSFAPVSPPPDALA